MNVAYNYVKEALLKRGYEFIEREGYLNLVGIRNTNDLQANTFNDVLCVCFIANGIPQIFELQCTTDPGTYYRNNPANVKGCAIVMPGQYKNLWAIGMHQGKYQALVQVNPVRVCRDNNRNSSLELTGPVESGLFGINCHRAQESDAFNQVNKWSAGCQVIARNSSFKFLMKLASESKQKFFTYTLLNDFDLE